jgi:hypothetical protein
MKFFQAKLLFFVSMSIGFWGDGWGASLIISEWIIDLIKIFFPQNH